MGRTAKAKRESPGLDRLVDAEVKLRREDTIGRVATILAIGLAVLISYPTIKSLAGKTTEVNLLAQVSWAVTFMTSAGWWNSSRRRKADQRSRLGLRELTGSTLPFDDKGGAG